MKALSKLTPELANLLCWYRISVSILLACTITVHPVLAVLYATAFLSDVVDGYCYRRFAKQRPPQHWFNRLPISLDPIADCIFVCGGALHFLGYKIGRPIVLALILIVLVWNYLISRASAYWFSILATSLTYYWYALMMLAMAAVWYRDATQYWLVGIVVTLIIFYSIWFTTNAKARMIRRRS